MASQREREKRALRYTDAKKHTEEHDSGFKPTAFTIPEGMELLRFTKPGTYEVDVIPYVVGEGNPRAEPGDVHFERTLFVHRGVGADQNTYCCPRKVFNKPCCICDTVAEITKTPDYDKKLVQDIKVKERQLWLFRIVDEKTGKRRIKLYEGSYYFGFGELLGAKIKASEKMNAGYENFFHLEDGFTLYLLVEEGTFNGKTINQITNIEMKPREQPIPDTILDRVPCLDDLPIEIDNDKLMQLFSQGTGGPSKASKGKAKPEPEDDDDGLPPAKPAARRAAPPADDDDDLPPRKAKAAPVLEEDEGCDFAEGDSVKFAYKDKTYRGIVVSVNVKRGIAEVDCGGTKPNVVNLEDLLPAPVKKAAPPPEDDDDLPPAKPAKRAAPVDEDDDDLPPAKPKAKAKAPPPEDDDDDLPPAKATRRAAPPPEDDDDLPPPRKTKPAPLDDDDDLPPAPKSRRQSS